MCRSLPSGLRRGLREGLIDIGEDVADILDANREAHRVLANARCVEFLVVELRVRR